jgi:hypothetical protein
MVPVRNSQESSDSSQPVDIEKAAATQLPCAKPRQSILQSCLNSRAAFLSLLAFAATLIMLALGLGLGLLARKNINEYQINFT